MRKANNDCHQRGNYEEHEVEMKLLKFIAEKEKSGTKTSMTIEAPWRK
jgi:hypothetical protein